MDSRIILKYFIGFKPVIQFFITLAFILKIMLKISIKVTNKTKDRIKIIFLIMTFTYILVQTVPTPYLSHFGSLPFPNYI